MLPTEPAVLEVVARERSGWEGFDRAVRDHLVDARRFAPDGFESAWWAHRALTLGVLYGADGRRREDWSDPARFNGARLCALEIMRRYGVPGGVVEEIAEDARRALARAAGAADR